MTFDLQSYCHSIQVYYVWYEGWYYPIRKVKSDSILTRLCNNGFRCRSGLQCKYSHCEEELSYWRGRFARSFCFVWYTSLECACMGIITLCSLIMQIHLSCLHLKCARTADGSVASFCFSVSAGHTLTEEWLK